MKRFALGGCGGLMVWLSGLAPLQANPVGEAVVAGAAGFNRAGNALTISQTTSKLIINWNDFSIAAGELTRFVQPNAAATALNRVVTGNPSAIFGRLEANGSVFLINPNGILVGPSGVINTRSFVGSTLDLDNEQFLRGGSFTLEGTSRAALENHGKIEALGGDIFLVAQTVRNSGELSAPQGTVGLGAGTEVVLLEAGPERLGVIAGPKDAQGQPLVDNVGAIRATAAELKAAGGNIYALAINNGGMIRADTVVHEGGRIFLRAGNGAVENRGTLDASASGAGAKGGEVQVTGAEVRLTGQSVVDVSGDAGGGRALIGGGYQGQDPQVPNAQRAWVGPNARIVADARQQGDGGQVVVWADGSTQFQGQITARGGSAGGDGGLVETSGKQSLTVGRGARVNAAAASGRSGTWLLDPTDIEIIATGGDLPPGNPPTADANTIGADDIVSALEGGTDVSIATASAFNGAGNITVSAPITKAAGGDAKLTLDAENDITIAVNAAIGSTAGKLSLLLKADSDNAGGGALTISSPLDANGGTVALDSARVTLAADVKNAGTLSGTATAVTVQTGGSIQDGIDIANPGATVTVAPAAAAYAEHLTVNKALTLEKGASQPAGPTEATVKPTTAGVTLSIGSDDVTVRGLTLESADTAAGDWPVQIAAGSDRVTLRDNGINSGANGSKGVSLNGAYDTLNFIGNTFTFGQGAVGLDFNPETTDEVAKNVTVQGNTFTARAAATDHNAIKFGNVVGLTLGGPNAADRNTIGSGVVFVVGGNANAEPDDTKDLVIRNNTFGAAGGTAFGPLSDYGLGFVRDGGSATPDGKLDGVTIQDNVFAGRGTAVEFYAADPLDAQSLRPENFANAPVVTGNAFSGGQRYVTDRNKQVNLGAAIADNTFDGAAYASDGFTIYRGIQDAVNQAAAAGTVNIRGNADYDEDVTIDKNLTLKVTPGTATANSWTAGNTVSLSLDGGFAADGALSFLGPVTLAGTTTLGGAPATFGNVAGGGNDLLLNGQAVLGGTVTAVKNLTANGSVAINGKTVTTSGVQTYKSTVTFGDNTVLTAPEIDFDGPAGSVSGAGFELTLQPVAAADAIAIGRATDPAGLAFEISDKDLAALANGFSGIVIGQAGGAHAITVESASFKDPLTLRTPSGGSIAIADRLDTTGGNDAAGITLRGSGATTTLNGDVVTAGGAILINDQVVLGTPATIALDTTAGGTVAAGANVQITGTVTDDATASTLIARSGTSGTATFDGNITAAGLTVQGATALNADTVTTAGGAQDYQGALTLGGAGVTKTLTANTVGFRGDVSGANKALTVDAAAAIDGSAVNTAGGSQLYKQGVTLGGAAGTKTLTANQVTFDGNVTGPGQGLTVDAATALNADSVVTAGGDQRYQGAVTLGGAGVAKTFQGRSVRFDSTVAGGAKDLTAIATDTLTVGNAVTVANASLRTGTLALNGNLDTGAGAVTLENSATASGNGRVTAKTLTLKGGGAVGQPAAALKTTVDNLAFDSKSGGDTRIDELNDIVVSGSTAGGLTLTANGVTFDTAAVGGALDVTAAGAIQQNPLTQLEVGGSADLNANANRIALANPNNDFIGSVTVNNTGANDVELTDRNRLAVGGSVGQDLKLTSAGLGLNATTVARDLTATTAGSVDQTAGLTVQGNTKFTLTAAATDVDLSQAANDYRAITIETAGAGTARDLRLRNGSAAAVDPVLPANVRNLVLRYDQAGIRVPGVTVAQDLDVTAAGSIQQANAISVGGNSQFTVRAADADVLLASFANTFGPVTLAASGPGSVRDFELWNNAPGAVTPVLPASLRNLTLRYDQAPLVLPGVALTGKLTATANGTISQAATVDVAGDSLLTVTAPNSDVLLPGPGNTLGPVTIAATGAGTVRDVYLQNDAAAAAYPTLPAGLRDLTLFFDTAGVTLPALTVSGKLDVTARGAGTVVAGLIQAAQVILNTTTLAVNANIQAPGGAVTIEHSGVAGGSGQIAAANLTLRGTGDAGLQSAAAAIVFGKISGQTHIDQFGNVIIRGNTGGDLTIVGAGTTFATTAIGGNLDVTATGPVSQDPLTTLTVNGTSRLSAGANPITLANTGNDFVGQVTVVNGAGVGLKDVNALNVTGGSGSLDAEARAGDLTLAGYATTGDLTGVAGGDVKATGDVGVGGKADLRAGGEIRQTVGKTTVVGTTRLDAGTEIVLNNVANDFVGSVTVVSGGNAELTDLGAIDLEGADVAGDLTVTANGTITDSGTLVVGGTTRLQGAPGDDITLDDPDNDFVGPVSVAQGGHVTLVDRNTLDLGASTIAGDLTVTANGLISDSGDLEIGGITTLAAGAANDIILDQPGNNFIGSVGITSGRNVQLVDQNALALGASTVAGSLEATASGRITQDGLLEVQGPTILTVQAADSDILLHDFDNLLSAVTIQAAAPGSVRHVQLLNTRAGAPSPVLPTTPIPLGNVWLTYSQSPLALQPLTVTGDLTVEAGGPVTQTGALLANQPGTTVSIEAGAANDVALDNAANDFATVKIVSANNATLRDANALELGPSTVAGTLDVVAGGALTQSGPLTANRLNAATRSDGLAPITLTDPANDVATVDLRVRNAADLANGAADVTYRDATGFDLAALRTAGTGSLEAGGAIVGPDGKQVSGTIEARRLNVTAGGAALFGDPDPLDTAAALQPLNRIVELGDVTVGGAFYLFDSDAAPYPPDATPLGSGQLGLTIVGDVLQTAGPLDSVVIRTVGDMDMADGASVIGTGNVALSAEGALNTSFHNYNTAPVDNVNKTDYPVRSTAGVAYIFSTNPSLNTPPPIPSPGGPLFLTGNMQFVLGVFNSGFEAFNNLTVLPAYPLVFSDAPPFDTSEAAKFFIDVLKLPTPKALQFDAGYGEARKLPASWIYTSSYQLFAPEGNEPAKPAKAAPQASAPPDPEPPPLSGAPDTGWPTVALGR